jgi:hypothetical protein
MARKRKNRSKSDRKIVRSASRSKKRKGLKPVKQQSGARKRPRRTPAKSEAMRRPRPKPRKPASVRPKRVQKPPLAKLEPHIEAAVRDINRGRSLTVAARESQIPAKELQKILVQHRLVKRKGQRWIAKDDRPRRVPVMTGGRFRVLTVRGYDEARLVGEHHHAAGEFVRTNAIELIKPFKGKTVETVGGRKYPLETSPNALHRIAAMDTPPFHEIYEITSGT